MARARRESTEGDDMSNHDEYCERNGPEQMFCGCSDRKELATLRQLVQIAAGCLSDIHLSDDMTLDLARRKAGRIYEQISAEKAL